MTLSVNIEGNGTVEGGVNYVSGSIAILNAIPNIGWSFKCYQINGITYTDNPYSMTVGAEDVSITAVFYVSFEDYIKGLLGFEISDLALNTIRIKRGIDYAADVSILSIRTLELAEADAIKWYVSSPTNFTGSKDSDGGWSHQDASSSLSESDRKLLMNRASMLYAKWGEQNGYGVTAKIINLY